MPIRTASLKKKISANGQALHRAMARRSVSGGADNKPSEAEAALLEERKHLKEERAKVRAQPRHRKTALERLVRTHHPEAKSTSKKSHEHGEVKKPKARRSRAEKHAEQAAAIEAARTSRGAGAKKPAAKPAK